MADRFEGGDERVDVGRRLEAFLGLNEVLQC